MFSSLALSAIAATSPFRPPAVPLVAHDPYFSVWSFSDRLTDDWTRHWTGRIHAMCGMMRVDGKTYRFASPRPESTPPMKQVQLNVTPTKTSYRFEAGGMRLDLTFLTPALPSDLPLLSRPITYVTFETRSTDGKAHDASLYFDLSGEWCVNDPGQRIDWRRERMGKLDALRFGTVEQKPLNRSGDDLRIDWGYHYLVGNGQMVVGRDTDCRNGFATDGSLPPADEGRKPRAASDEWPVMAARFDLGKVQRPVSRRLLIGYDDIQSIMYLGAPQYAHWREAGGRTPGKSFAAIAQVAWDEQAAIAKRCEKFDKEFLAASKKIGGEEYAQVAVLAYRQGLAACKLTNDTDGALMMWPKENFSNGCIATVDVIYPQCPQLLLFNPKLLEAQLTPVLRYAAMSRWPHPFAPHDLGTYPLANGQVYGDGEHGVTNQMPVEESGNMLIMLAALAHIQGNAEYARQYWPVLTKWADYLLAKGLDPAEQLCTDDFAGHMAHNANLSIKAVLGIGCYARLCEMLGKDGTRYRADAERMAKEWETMARDGDHYRLAFDKPGTWSQKYNLVWDRVLGLELFSPSIAETELKFYKTKLGKYGLPLDNRSAYTKSDWCVWTATLARSRQDFDAIFLPLYRSLNDTPDRVPMTDWYWTTDAKKVGFQARSVVGGVFMPFLADKAMWKKWASGK